MELIIVQLRNVKKFFKNLSLDGKVAKARCVPKELYPLVLSRSDFK